MSVRILITTLLIPALTFCQKTIKGRVIDKSSQISIPYATIGLLKQNVGINADKGGYFTFIEDVTDLDTLIISAVGYESLKTTVSRIKQDSIIELEKKIVVLSEVKVSSKTNWQYLVLNKLDCSNKGLTTTGFTTQIAQRFRVPEKNCQLTVIKICTNSPPFITKRAKFLIRIYDIDSATGTPSSELTNKIIEVESDKRIANIDVEEMQIFIPNNQFFIAVEWLKMPYNEDKKGKYSTVSTYRPSISFKEDKGEEKEIWMLTYRNEWFAISKNSRAAISVRVKY